MKYSILIKFKRIYLLWHIFSDEHLLLIVILDLSVIFYYLDKTQLKFGSFVFLSNNYS